ncbi:MAG TPA: response regulator transcription factor [Gemmatimonadales bacterium]|nr:response regulator transcription factor [Gemmatimonadales bacterium]
MLKQSRPGGVSGGILRVVLVDEPTASSDALVGALRATGREVLVERADSEEALVTLLKGFWPDVLFTAAHPGPLGLPAILAAVRAFRPAVPVILLAGAGDGHRTAAWIRAGVEEVIRRDAIAEVTGAVQRALEVRQPLARLSPRQIEVLRLITEGLTSREIAARLQLSEKTVETHRSAVAQRLGIRDVAGLVRYAVRVGLTSLAPPFDGRKREAGAGLAASRGSAQFPGD